MSDTMRALRCTAFGPIDTLAVQDIPLPQPGPGQVRVRVEAAALNYPDALIVQGLYQVKPPLPFTPGSEYAGTVDALGEGVPETLRGTRVIGLGGSGGMAQYAVVDAARTLPLPPEMDFDSGAAFVLTYGTSLHALQECARLQPGETVLVLGAAGGVGVAAIELAKAMGARVLAAASTPGKLALCTRLGADAVVNYDTEDLRAAIKAFAGDDGIDVVYDPVGGPYTEPAVRSLAWGGRLLVVGFAAGDIPRLPLNLALLKERHVIGVFWGAWTQRDPAGHVRNLRQLQAWFEAGKVRPVISDRVPLDAAAAAIARIAQRGVMGKVVIRPWA